MKNIKRSIRRDESNTRISDKDKIISSFSKENFQKIKDEIQEKIL